MDEMPLSYYKEMDDRMDRWEANRDYALEAFYDDAEQIALKVEHCIHHIDLVVNINCVRAVAKAINEIEALGEYYLFDEDLEYEFTDQATTFIADHLGLILEDEYEQANRVV